MKRYESGDIRRAWHFEQQGFMAYTMLNHLRNTTKLQYREIVRALDKMQMSDIKEDDNEELIYMRGYFGQTMPPISVERVPL